MRVDSLPLERAVLEWSANILWLGRNRKVVVLGILAVDNSD